jgi:hypothetical protein
VSGPKPGNPNLGAAGREARSRLRRERMARLCDLIADGETVKRAAALIGVTESAATNMLTDIKRELGWQAQ